MTARRPPDGLLRTVDVARLFRVSPSTVTRWADAGLLTVAKRTGGGQRRYRAEEVYALYHDETRSYPAAG